MVERARRDFLRYRDRGDSQALGRVFDSLAHRLLLLAMHVVRDRAEAEDVVQETFLRVMREADRYDAERPLFPWLVGILQNEARMARRRSRRAPNPDRVVATRNADPIEEVSERDLVERVSRQISQFPKTYRDVLDLRLTHDLQAAEIAHSLGRPLATVHTQLRRGLEMLRRALPAGRLVPGVLALDCGAGLAAIRHLVVDTAVARAGSASAAAATGVTGSAALGGVIMLKKVLLVSVAALVVLFVPLWILWGDIAGTSGAAAATINLAAGGEDPREVPPAIADRVAPDSRSSPLRRSVLAAGLRSDPVFQAALCGFRGRIVTSAGEPVVDCGVRIYRFALDEWTAPEALAVEWPNSDFQYLGGEARTDDDGAFTITGTRPRGTFVLQGGIGTDNPTHVLVPKTPGPGELVDLGDIRLDDGAVLEGIVVDDAGEPLAGATVRAADVPADLLRLVPGELFDPDGALLFRGSSRPAVVEMPPWVGQVIDDLPIPNARTDQSGHFKLIGLRAGNNVVAVAKRGHVSSVNSVVDLDAGMHRDLGRVRLQRGERIAGRVLDGNGAPVVGARVAAFPTSAAALVGFGSFVGPTDPDGRFAAAGYPPGRVILAARRQPGDPWVVTEPQRVDRDMSVQLPVLSSLTVTLLSEDELPIRSPSLRLRPGARNTTPAPLANLGLTEEVDIGGRIERLGDNRYRIDDLSRGAYTLTARSAEHAVATVDISLDHDLEIEVVLPGLLTRRVRVIDDTGQPIAHAAIHGTDLGAEATVGEATLCGYTRDDGRLTIDQLSGARVRLQATHPAYGAARVEAGSDVVEISIEMASPGAIEGDITERAQPAAAGKYSVIASNADRPPGLLLDQTLWFAVQDAAGCYRFSGLQPGRYLVRVVASQALPNSPGSLYAFALSLEMEGVLARGVVTVAAGELAHLDLETDRLASGTEPTSRITGVFMVNGKPGIGALIQVWGDRGARETARVDETGNFDVRQAPAGKITLVVRDLGTTNMVSAVEGSRHTLWHEPLVVPSNEVRHVVIDLEMCSLSGSVVTPDGEPVESAGVRLTGIIPRRSAGPGETNTLHYNRISDPEGRFRFDRIPVGRYSISARAKGGGGGIAVHSDIAVRPRQPVSGLRLQTEPAYSVRGRLDLSSFGGARPEGLFLRFIPTAPAAGSALSFSLSAFGRVAEDGTFEATGLRPGSYAVRWFRGDEPPLDSADVVVVENANRDGVVVRPVIER